MNALLAAALLAASTPQAPPVFRAEVDVVRVEVLVTRGGTPVRGLGAADFEVRDNGRLQALEPILEEETPVDAILVLDMSGSVNGPKLDALKAAGRAFLDGLREGEQAALLAFHHEVQLLEPLTADVGAVRRALERASPRGSTALVDAVYSALRLREPGERRTAIVVFSDGIDNLSWLPASDVVEAASRSNVDRLRRGRAREGRPEGALPERRRPGDRRAAVRGLERARPAGAVPRRARRHPRPLRAELRPGRDGHGRVAHARGEAEARARATCWRGPATGGTGRP